MSKRRRALGEHVFMGLAVWFAVIEGSAVAGAIVVIYAWAVLLLMVAFMIKLAIMGDRILFTLATELSRRGQPVVTREVRFVVNVVFAGVLMYYDWLLTGAAVIMGGLLTDRAIVRVDNLNETK